MKIDKLGRPSFPAETANAFNRLMQYVRLLNRYVITSGKAEEIEAVIRFAVATPERRLDIGFMFLDNCAQAADADDPILNLVRSTPWAITDDMKLGALEGLIDSLRIQVIERTRLDEEAS